MNNGNEKKPNKEIPEKGNFSADKEIENLIASEKEPTPPMIEEKNETKNKVEQIVKKEDPAKENFKNAVENVLEKKEKVETPPAKPDIFSTPVEKPAPRNIKKEVREKFDAMNNPSLEEAKLFYKALKQTMEQQDVPFRFRRTTGIWMREFLLPPWNIFRLRNPRKWQSLTVRLFRKWEKYDTTKILKKEYQESFLQKKIAATS